MINKDSKGVRVLAQILFLLIGVLAIVVAQILANAPSSPFSYAIVFILFGDVLVTIALYSLYKILLGDERLKYDANKARKKMTTIERIARHFENAFTGAVRESRKNLWVKRNDQSQSGFQTVYLVDDSGSILLKVIVGQDFIMVSGTTTIIDLTDGHELTQLVIELCKWISNYKNK